MRIALFIWTFLITTIWLAMLSAGLGIFNAPFTVTAGLTVAVVISFIRRNDCCGRLSRWDGLAALIATGTLFLTLPPGELILGGWDPGVYLHTGMEIVRTKSFQFDHVDLNSMPTPDQALLMRDLHGIPEPFGGMRILENGLISPQFYHAYPSLLAVVMFFGGIIGALFVNPLLNVGSILAFYALIALVTKSRPWGILGALLLTVNPAQIWMAKFSTAELLTQFMILSGLAFLHRWQEDPSRRLTEATLGGACLGVAQLTRYDALVFFAIALPVLWIAVNKRTHRQGIMAAMTMFALAALHAWAHQRWIAPYYQPLGATVGYGLLACGIATAVAVLFMRFKSVQYLAARLRPLVPILATLSWTAWMTFNWLVRPHLDDRYRIRRAIESVLEYFGLEAWLAPLTGPVSRAMLYLQSIFGMTGLAVALAGVIFFIWKPKKPVELAWLWGGMAVTVLLTWHPYNDLFMMWVSRRYVPVVIPWLITAMIVGGLAIGNRAMVRWPSHARVLRIAVPACLILATSPVFSGSLFLARHRDWPGLIGWYQALEKHIPRGQAVYTDQPGFAAPLRFLWRHHAFELHHPDRGRRDEFYQVVARAARQRGPVYLLTAIEPDPAILSPSFCTPKYHAPMVTHIMEQPAVTIPDSLRPRGGPFVLYEIIAHDPAWTSTDEHEETP